MVNIIVSGCMGRMGKSIIKLANFDKEIEIIGALEAPKHTFLGKDIGEVLGLGVLDVKISDKLDKSLKKAEVIIEFTNPAVTLHHLEIAKKAKKGMVIGTTGLKEEDIEKIKDASKKIPVVFSPNMSLGVNLLFELVSDCVKRLGRDYDIEIMEAHHRFKKDAPSGTAKEFAQIIANAMKEELSRISVYGRSGIIGERPDNELGIHSVRGGDIVGDHTIMFCGMGERIELTHRAHSRDAFSQGAIRAAKFVAKKKNGFFTMKDVLKEG